MHSRHNIFKKVMNLCRFLGRGFLLFKTNNNFDVLLYTVQWVVSPRKVRTIVAARGNPLVLCKGAIHYEIEQQQVIVDPATLGSKLRLCGVRPYYEYVDGRRTDNLLGHTYTVTCSGFAGDRMDVKIPGKQLLDTDALDRLVRFSGLAVSIYPSYVKGQHGIDAVCLKATATGVSVIDG